MDERVREQRGTEPEGAAAAPLPGTAPAVRPEVVPLADVLRQIRRDSRREPGRYLDETRVPFGGE